LTWVKPGAGTARYRDPMMRLAGTKLRSLQGAVLGMGAPVGWMAIQGMAGADPFADFYLHAGIYLYMLVGTVIVFAAFGAYVGTQEARAYERATHDELTGLFNRRYFWQRLREEYHSALRHHRPLSLIEADLDHFKRVNDSRGHAAGDRVLKAVAGALTDAKRSSDIIARIGGEELAVILRDTDIDEATRVAERMRLAVGALRVTALPGTPVQITASFGVACSSPADPADAELLLLRADRAMYRAKTEGRDCVVQAPMSWPGTTEAAASK